MRTNFCRQIGENVANMLRACVGAHLQRSQPGDVAAGDNVAFNIGECPAGLCATGINAESAMCCR